MVWEGGGGVTYSASVLREIPGTVRLELALVCKGFGGLVFAGCVPSSHGELSI